MVVCHPYRVAECDLSQPRPPYAEDGVVALTNGARNRQLGPGSWDMAQPADGFAGGAQPGP